MSGVKFRSRPDPIDDIDTFLSDRGIVTNPNPRTGRGPSIRSASGPTGKGTLPNVRVKTPIKYNSNGTVTVAPIGQNKQFLRLPDTAFGLAQTVSIRTYARGVINTGWNGASNRGGSNFAQLGPTPIDQSRINQGGFTVYGDENPNTYIGTAYSDMAVTRGGNDNIQLNGGLLNVAIPGNGRDSVFVGDRSSIVNRDQSQGRVINANGNFVDYNRFTRTRRGDFNGTANYIDLSETAPSRDNIIYTPAVDPISGQLLAQNFSVIDEFVLNEDNISLKGNRDDYYFRVVPDPIQGSRLQATEIYYVQKLSLGSLTTPLGDVGSPAVAPTGVAPIAIVRGVDLAQEQYAPSSNSVTFF